MPRVYQCIRSHYVVSVKPKHSIRVYLCPSVAQKTKLRKLTERQRKQAIWPRMDTDTHGCGVPASSRSTGRRLEQNCMVMFWRNAILELQPQRYLACAPAAEIDAAGRSDLPEAAVGDVVLRVAQVH